MIASLEIPTPVQVWKGKPLPHIQWEIIGPEKAQEYLDMSFVAYESVPSSARRMARKMSEGRWGLTYETISFDGEIDDDHPFGYLLQGEDVLLSIIRSNTHQCLLVRRGCLD